MFTRSPGQTITSFPAFTVSGTNVATVTNALSVTAGVGSGEPVQASDTVTVKLVVELTLTVGSATGAAPFVQV
jgi:hypothetical protein